MMLNDKPHKKDGLELSQKEVGQIVAALLLGAFFIFAGGYFFGKKKMLEEFAAQQNDECFADKVYNSFTALSEDLGSESSQEVEALMSSLDIPSEIEREIVGEEEPTEVVAAPSKPQKIAYAQLCGFGTKHAAEQYQGRLKKRAVDVTHIVERKSTSKKGKVINWYQVVTDPMEKNELLPFVEIIKKHDKLTGVKIIDLKADEA